MAEFTDLLAKCYDHSDVQAASFWETMKGDILLLCESCGAKNDSRMDYQFLKTRLLELISAYRLEEVQTELQNAYQKRQTLGEIGLLNLYRQIKVKLGNRFVKTAIVIIKSEED